MGIAARRLQQRHTPTGLDARELLGLAFAGQHFDHLVAHHQPPGLEPRRPTFRQALQGRRLGRGLHGGATTPPPGPSIATARARAVHRRAPCSVAVGGAAAGAQGGVPGGRSGKPPLLLGLPVAVRPRHPRPCRWWLTAVTVCRLGRKWYPSVHTNGNGAGCNVLHCGIIPDPL